MLKRAVQYGVFPWWPQDGNDWIHPDDIRLARRLIPSSRVFRREPHDEEYFLLRYGRDVIRAKPALWKVVRTDGFEIGDRVEILSRLGQNLPAVAVIREMRWNADARQIEYFLRRAGRNLSRAHVAADLRRVDELDPPSRLSVVIVPSLHGDSLLF